MINLAIFCPECTLWLILMLLGAWVLGWLLWGIVKGSQYKTEIKHNEDQISDLTEKNTNLKSELNDEKYAHEKKNMEYDKLRSRNIDLDMQYKVQMEQLGNIQVAYDKLKADYDALKS